MSNYKDLKKKLVDLGEEFFYSGANESSEIVMVEKELGVSLPDDYKLFLMDFGSGDYNGVEIYGTGKKFSHKSIPSVIFATKEQRKGDARFPMSFLVIGNDGSGNLICLDCEKDKVFYWGLSLEDAEPQEKISDNFVQYVVESFEI